MLKIIVSVLNVVFLFIRKRTPGYWRAKHEHECWWRTRKEETIQAQQEMLWTFSETISKLRQHVVAQDMELQRRHRTIRDLIRSNASLRGVITRMKKK